MDVSEDLDREVIIERAEALRAWLAGFGFSGRTATALERELQGIIANDPGGYIHGQRPLAGYTVAEFVAALHSRNGGAVGQVKSVGDAVLKELRAAIPPDAASVPEPEPEPVAPVPAAEVVAAPDAEPVVEAPAQKRRGRPKGSTSARKNGAASAGKNGTAPAPETQAPAAPEAEAPAPVAEAVAEAPAAPVAEAVADAPAPKRRGRPKGSTSARKSVAPPTGKPAASSAPAPTAPVGAAPAAPPAGGDSALGQLVRLWPGLHPQARRAVVLYASELLAEAAAGR